MMPSVLLDLIIPGTDDVTIRRMLSLLSCAWVPYYSWALPVLKFRPQPSVGCWKVTCMYVYSVWGSFRDWA